MVSGVPAVSEGCHRYCPCSSFSLCPWEALIDRLDKPDERILGLMDSKNPGGDCPLTSEEAKFIMCVKNVSRR